MRISLAFAGLTMLCTATGMCATAQTTAPAANAPGQIQFRGVPNTAPAINPDVPTPFSGVGPAVIPPVNQPVIPPVGTPPALPPTVIPPTFPPSSVQPALPPQNIPQPVLPPQTLQPAIPPQTMQPALPQQSINPALTPQPPQSFNPSLPAGQLPPNSSMNGEEDTESPQ